MGMGSGSVGDQVSITSPSRAHRQAGRRHRRLPVRRKRYRAQDVLRRFRHDLPVEATLPQHRVPPSVGK